MTRKNNGYTLIQLLITSSIIIVLTTIGLPYYRQHQLKAHLQEAQSILMNNSHHLEQHYQRHLSYKKNQTEWADLPITKNQYFCFRLLGNPHKHPGNSFSIKAVALDKNNEPRILKLNRHGTVILCQTSESTCDEDKPFFDGKVSIDRNCSLFNH